MFRNILVPLDGSPFAEQALPWALSLARRAGAGLDLVRVHVLYALGEPACGWLPYDPAEEAECQRREQLYLDATARWLAAVSRLPITPALVFGLGAEPILDRARARRTDLVVMTTHGRGPLGRFALGSVADEVVRRAGLPVLLLRPREPAPALLPEPAPENILVPLDGSALAEQALGPALDVARLTEGRCTLLRVVGPDDEQGGRRPGGAGEIDAESYLEQVAGRFRAEGVLVRSQVIVAASPAETIREEARALGSDLIVLATHGRGGLRRLLLGSVADKVLRGGTTPVLVCPPVI
jgi:nucleotide-binding universal stress UspA family protein